MFGGIRNRILKSKYKNKRISYLVLENQGMEESWLWLDTVPAHNIDMDNQDNNYNFNI